MNKESSSVFVFFPKYTIITLLLNKMIDLYLKLT